MATSQLAAPQCKRESTQPAELSSTPPFVIARCLCSDEHVASNEHADLSSIVGKVADISGGLLSALIRV